MTTAQHDRPAPATYRLAREQFAALATGGGDAETVRFLAGAEFSRRLLLLQVLCDEAVLRMTPDDPLPSVEHAWNVMALAQQRDPQGFLAALMYPHIGNWAAYTLRQHLGTETDAPAWTDFGQLHAVALVAAARCGVDWETRLPLHRGRVTLPGLGQARFEYATDRWDAAHAQVDGGRIRLWHDGTAVAVPADHRQDAAGWWGLRELGPGLRVALDDIDPFRNLAEPVRPDRLTTSEVDTWRSLLQQAWTLLEHDEPTAAEALAAGVSSLSPLARADQQDDEEVRSASTAESFGAVLLSSPTTAADFAAALVHEFQHIKLGGLMHLCDLNADDGAANLYAPWRDDPRPLGGLLQGVYAFLGIARFWRVRHRSKSGAERRSGLYAYAYARAQAAEGLEITRASGGLTSLGVEFTDGLAATIGRWSDDTIPAEIERLVRIATTAHRTTWRIRHRRPTAEAVAEVAKAWSRGHTPDEALPGAFSIEPPAEPPSLSTVWTNPIRRALHTPPLPTTPAAALITGDVTTAKAGFLDRVIAAPNDIFGWVGLAISCAELNQAKELLDRPDLIRAAYLTLRIPSLLTNWLA